MKAFLTLLSPGKIGALVLCVLLGLAALVLKFCLPGYSFSALVCVLLILVILFYVFMPLVGLKYPRFADVTLRTVTAVLAAGILVVGVTECCIIKASFGDPDAEVDYVVVLGAKVRDTGPSVSLWDRIYGVYDYLQEHPNAVAVVSGGQGPDEPMSEGQAMYAELTALGVAEDRIWVEDRATSTWENLNLSLDLIEERTGIRPKKLGVVSSEYHLFRASLFAKKCGVEFVGIPARTSRPGQMINHFMREVAGVWHYILLGGQYD